MAEILIRHYIYGIILFTLLITAGVSLITDISTTEGNLLNDDEITKFNRTFNKRSDLEASINTMQTNIESTSSEGGILTALGVLGSLINSVWNSLALMFSSFSFMGTILLGSHTIFGLPSWLAAFIGLFITVLIAFGIFTIIFQREA